jgi:hypothetical protein
VQVPLHPALAQPKDDTALRALVRGNWVRTALWTAPGAQLLGAVGWLLRMTASAGQ